jgi:hypothetical protein
MIAQDSDRRTVTALASWSQALARLTEVEAALAAGEVESMPSLLTAAMQALKAASVLPLPDEDDSRVARALRLVLLEAHAVTRRLGTLVEDPDSA